MQETAKRRFHPLAASVNLEGSTAQRNRGNLDGRDGVASDVQ